MKRQLYHGNTYCFDFKSKILSCDMISGKYYVRLEHSYFYPESGGQIADKGTINGIPVERIDIDSNENVILIISRHPGSNEAECVISQKDRMRNMRFHTVQHIISAVAKNKYGAGTGGFHMSETYSSVDLDIPEIDRKMRENIEDEVNSIIMNNIQVRTYWVKQNDALAMELRSKKVYAEELRVVEIEGVDRTLCAGTHIAATGEAGLCHITDIEKIRGMSRVFYLCGMEAAEYMNKTAQRVDALKDIFSVPADRLLSVVEKSVNEHKKCLKENRNLKKYYAENKAENIYDIKSKSYLFRDDIVSMDYAPVFGKKLIKLGAERCVLYFNEEDTAMIFTAESNEAEKAGRFIMDRTGCRGGGKNGFYRLNNIKKEILFDLIRGDLSWN